MAFKTFFAAVALACLCVAIASPSGQGPCSRQNISNVQKQIEICTRDVTSDRFNDPGEACGREAAFHLRAATTCSLDDIPGRLRVCLRYRGASALKYDEAEACVQRALDIVPTVPTPKPAPSN
ncbi:hypothetical protein FOCC_FOCC000302, partial [Frankliniella occidentalis]